MSKVELKHLESTVYENYKTNLKSNIRKAQEQLDFQNAELQGWIEINLDATDLKMEDAGLENSWYDITGTDDFTQSVKIPDILRQAQRQSSVLNLNLGVEGIEWQMPRQDGQN